ncbi:hypothetical protein IQ07DRAFT_593608, partial [Pyrenochaeta sp. DS3sAY3a]
MFDSFSGMVVAGRLTRTGERSCYPRFKECGSFTQHAKFVSRAARRIGKAQVEIVPIAEYLFRHDDRCDVDRMRRRRYPHHRDDSARYTDQGRALVLQDVSLPVQAVADCIRAFPHRPHHLARLSFPSQATRCLRPAQLRVWIRIRANIRDDQVS